MATLSDIAIKTRLSQATVSQILNGHEGFKPATRDLVLKTAKQMDYRPNHLSQSLAKGKSMAIGVIGKGLRNALAHSHALSLTKAARNNGYLTYAVNIEEHGDDSATFIRIARDLIDRQVDGLAIYRNLPICEKAQQFIASHNIPVVFVGDWGPAQSQNRIALDMEAGIKEAAQRLAELGHRQAVYFASSGQADFPEHKLRPYQRHFADAGVQLDMSPDWIDSETNVDDAAYQAVREYLNIGGEATALLMSNDIAAVGAMAGLRACGFTVPDDFSVVGFDNIGGMKYVNPPLTTIGGPDPEKVGQAAFEMLHDLMINPKAHIQMQTFPFKLIERGSIGPVNQSENISSQDGQLSPADSNFTLTSGDLS